MARFNPSKIKNMETNDEKKARVTFEQPEEARISEEDLRFVASYQRDNKHYLQQPEAAGQEQEDQTLCWKDIYMSFNDGEGWTNFASRMSKYFTITRKP